MVLIPLIAFEIIIWLLAGWQMAAGIAIWVLIIAAIAGMFSGVGSLFSREYKHRHDVRVHVEHDTIEEHPLIQMNSIEKRFGRRRQG